MRLTLPKRGLSDVYSRMMRWSTTPKVQENDKLHDPTRSTQSSEDMPEEGRPRRLPVLGKPRAPKPVKLDEFVAWPTQKCREFEPSRVDSVLQGALFGTVEEKLATSKRVAQELQIAVPDSVLNKDLEGLRQYLAQSNRRFNEGQPDAVYLEGSYGPNVTIEPTVQEKRALVKRNKALLREARQRQAEEVSGMLSR